MLGAGFVVRSGLRRPQLPVYPNLVDPASCGHWSGFVVDDTQPSRGPT
jgi:hypothetical protein